VLFHCMRGNDRTGIIALLVLALVGVTPEEIAADYALSPDAERDAILTREHTTVSAVLRGALEGLAVEEYLRQGGASQADLDGLRRRMMD
jgi:protein-tyrosine phosphatase